MSLTVIKQIDRAAAALHDERWSEALEHLLDLWRETRSPAVADLVDGIERRLTGATETASDPVRWGDRVVYHRSLHPVWLEVAGRRRSAELGWLLPVLAVGERSAEKIADRARLLLDWPDDPRLGAPLARYLITLPLATQTSRPFWDLVLQLVERSDDARAIEVLERSRGARASQLRGKLRTWLDGRVEQVLAVLRQRASERPPDAPELVERCQQLAVQLRPRDREQLHAEILADPGNDELRLVYADLLQEEGDPRGEFIALQYQRHRGGQSEEGRRREWDLFRKHYKEWLGPLVRVVDKRGFRDRKPPERMPFERGFLARCRVKPPQERDLLKVLGDPHWATVEDLFGWDTPIRVALHPCMLSLRHTQLHLSGLQALARVDGTRAFESVTVSGFNPGVRWHDLDGKPRIAPEELQQLLDCGAKLPRLRRLELQGDVLPDWGFGALSPEALAPLMDAALGRRLERLVIAVALGMVGAWQRFFSHTSLAELHLYSSDHYKIWLFRFARSEPGAGLDRLNVRVRRGFFDEPRPGDIHPLREALESIEPDGVRQLRLEAAPWVGEELRATLQRFTNLDKPL